jgi:hypothetical protein
MLLTRVRHKWPEAKNFQLVRPRGYPEYTFLHFLTPVTLQLGDASIEVKAGGCIFFPPGMPQFFTAKTALVHDWFHATAELGVFLAQYDLPQGQVFYPAEDAFITELLQKMELEYFSENKHKKVLLDASTTKIGSTLFFGEGEGNSTDEGIIYTQPSVTGSSILRANRGDEESNLNLELLFNATLAQRNEIAKLFEK